MTIRIYDVPQMSCDHCVSAITDAVDGLDGVSAVSIDLETKEVTIDGGADEAIREAIDDAGYDVGAPRIV